MNKAERQKIFQQIQKRYSITYYYSTCLFRRQVRQQVQILYAFLRYPDELVDNPQEGFNTNDLVKILDRLRNELAKRWVKNDQPNWEKLNKTLWKAEKIHWPDFEELILYEFVELAREHDFQFEWIEAFFNSMKMDLQKNRYENFEDLELYVYGSAEVVGLMMNRIMRQADAGKLADLAASDKAARKLGAAMQLTNFLRDLREDFERGRIYFPQDELVKYALTESEFRAGRSRKFFDWMDFQIERVRAYYQQVFEQADLIPENSRLAVLMASYVYDQVLEKIAINPGKIWTKNFKKTWWSFPKAFFLARKLIKSKKNHKK